MNLVGKIFVVLIFILSLVLMSMNVVLYMTHTNWHRMVTNTDTSDGYPLGLKEQVEQLKTVNNELQIENVNLSEAIEREENERIRTVVALENSLREKEKKLALTEEEIVKLNDQINENLSNAKTAEEDREKLIEREAKTVAALQITVEKRDQEVAKNIALTAERDNLLAEVESLKKQKERLAVENANANAVMAQLGIQPDVEYYRSLSAPEGTIGTVMAVAAGNVEVSVGSDEGVRAGHQFQVLSADGTKYLGKVQITTVEPDRAVGKHIPGSENGVYTPGCRVKPVTPALGGAK